MGRLSLAGVHVVAALALALLGGPSGAFTARGPQRVGVLSRGSSRLGILLKAALEADGGALEADGGAPAPKREMTLAERIAAEVGATMEEDLSAAAEEGEEVNETCDRDLLERIFEEDDRPVILFDSSCVFCDSGVQFIMANEARVSAKGGLFRYATQQSDVGKEIIARCGQSTDEVQLKSSIVLYEKDGFRMRSDAVLKIVANMRFPWSLFSVAALLSPPLRDSLYEFVSDNRHRFGAKDSCIIPEDDVLDKFIS